jgi:Flp pilus assembly protein protease CpaA
MIPSLLPGIAISWDTIVLCVFFALCLWGTVTDMSWGIVTNTNVLALLSLGAIVQTMQILRGEATWPQVLGLVCLAMVVGFGLFASGYWSAGDGKFYAAICIAFPLQLPAPAYVNAPVQIFSYTMATALCFLLVTRMRLIVAALGRELKAAFQHGTRHRSWQKLLKSAAIQTMHLLAFLGVTRLINLALPLPMGVLQSLMVALALTSLTSVLKPVWNVLIFLPLAAAAVYFLVQFSLVQTLTLILTYLLVYAGRAFIGLADRALPTSVPVAELRPGHYLKHHLVSGSDRSFHVMAEPLWRAAERQSYTHIAGPDDGALSPELAQQIHTLVEQRVIPGDATAPLVWSIPFAPVIMAGTMIVAAIRVLEIVH